MKLRDFAFLFIFFLNLLMIVPAAHAQLPPGIYSNCDFCLCSMGISPLTMNGSSIRFDSRYTELGSEFSNGASAPNPTNARETYLTDVLSLRGQITDQLSATLMVPFAHKAESSNDPANSLANISNSGVGDMSLLFRYNLIADHEDGGFARSILGQADMRMLAVTAGIKFANGSTALTYNGDRGRSTPADPDVQLGTGTTDFYAGLGYLLGFNGWNIEADALGMVHGFGSGASGHTYGDNLNYDVMAEYRLYEDQSFLPTMLSPTVFASLAIRGEWRGYETQDGVPLDNDLLGWSGGNVVYVAPGLQMFFAPRVSLDASVWVPVIHALYGNQLGETVKAMAGIQAGI
ncbi:MAG TPA: transporter [Candidatus Kapabacteria bacterium]|nr:transporter [Candidatus Kapabacteria bacterium]